MLCQSLDAYAVSTNLSCFLQAHEVTHDMFGETELSWYENHLTSWELELSTTKSFLGSLKMFWLCSDWDENASNINTCSFAKSLSVSVTHTGLKSISTGAWKHLIDTDDVPGVNSYADVETFSTSSSNHVFVGSNSGGFQCLRCELFLFFGDKMDTTWEKVPLCPLLATVVETDFRVRHTTIETWLGIWLVFLVSVATSGSSSHF